MVASSTLLVALTNTFFISQSLAAAVPIEKVAARDVGIPASNGPGLTCFNTWETATNDPVVQYWYVTAPNVGNDIKADRVWNHLNLNGCAVTENKYYVESNINGATLTFHTSEACTAARVSDALRSGSDPGVNIACQFNGKDDDITAAEGTATGVAGVLSGLGEAAQNL